MGMYQRGREGGATWSDEMRTVLDLQPEFLVICQMNEFAGQANGKGPYTDGYNYTYSNDLEPTDLNECGYVRPDDRRCGGWGFYWLNVLRASGQLLDAAAAGLPMPFT